MEKLKNSGNKLTKARREILAVLEQVTQPISAQAIHSHLKGVDLASVYRNLKLFKDISVVHVELGGKEEKYCLGLEPHHHITCSGCGYSESIKCNHKFTHNNFSFIKHQLSLTGICRKCL